MSAEYVLLLSCDDRPGIVAAVSGAIASGGGNILSAEQFEDRQEGRFFMRVRFAAEREADVVNTDLMRAVDEYRIKVRISEVARRKKVAILASRSDHCLADLLYRWRIGELAMDPVAIISNHPRETYRAVDLGDLPFHHFPATPERREAQEEQWLDVVQRTDADLVVLARYMQILSPRAAGMLAGRCVNIHHGFLPAFRGAKPYHQAHARGVKMIGATAHFVTADLDEGPIIEQDVERVSHRDAPEDLVRKGRDIERRVLSRAVHALLEDRVILNGDRTVVFQG